MTKLEYVLAVHDVLDAHFFEIKSNLHTTFRNLPAETLGLDIAAHVDQDGEGFLTLRVHLKGPDLYVLNKKIEQSAQLFDTVASAEGLSSGMPLMMPGGEEFDVPDVLTDCSLEWVEKNWEALEEGLLSLPAAAISFEGYGKLSPLSLR